MDLEAALQWLYAAAWLAAGVWVLIYGLTQSPRHGDAPRLIVVPMIAGMIVFLYWIVAGDSALGINHVRPSGVPLGLWGFGFACLMLLIGWRRIF